MSSAPKPPAELELGPHRYRIDASDETGQLLHGEDARGDSRPDQLLIRLNLQIPHTSAAETLLHETLHAAWDQTSLGLVHDDDAEEVVVKALAPLLLDLLRRNPKLVAYLTASG
jgi:hypothetical protein